MKSIGELTGSAPPPTFDMWWAAYPRKQGKKKAEAIYEKLSDTDKSACYLGTLRQVEENPQWAEDDRFIPMPTTFLNQARWQDEIPKTYHEKVASTPVENEAQLVWSALTQFYGTSFHKKHGQKPPELWRKMLKDMPEERLRRGLRATFDMCPEFPPSLPQFIAYCKPTFGELYPPVPQLPRPDGDPEIAADAFTEMKKILGVE
jgi:hypothetical protein